MAIEFSVGPGTVLLCDYSRGGFEVPEMVKRRPAVVISPKLAPAIATRFGVRFDHNIHRGICRRPL